MIISSVDSATLLGTRTDKHLNFEKHITIVSFYIFSSSRYSLLYIYLYIVNIFKYFFILYEIKKSYLYYYYHIKCVRFSLDLFPHSSSLPICCKKIV